jgi:hypothetical protein
MQRGLVNSDSLSDLMRKLDRIPSHHENRRPRRPEKTARQRPHRLLDLTRRGDFSSCSCTNIVVDNVGKRAWETAGDYNVDTSLRRRYVNRADQSSVPAEQGAH